MSLVSVRHTGHDFEATAEGLLTVGHGLSAEAAVQDLAENLAALMLEGDVLVSREGAAPANLPDFDASVERVAPATLSDDARQAAYSQGATAVWRMLGVADQMDDGGWKDLPNEAVFDPATSLYRVQPKGTSAKVGESQQPREPIADTADVGVVDVAAAAAAVDPDAGDPPAPGPEVGP